MKPIEFQILGVGAWGPAFRSWSDLSKILNGGTPVDDMSKGPKPEVIPKNERRRAPLPVRLAIESSWQAAAHAGLEPADLPCVFVSGVGDTQLTDYMCKTLASENKALSPTKFHNSVHNAAAGYWTISTGCMQAASSIAGFQESVSLTFMEALLQVNAEQTAVLITFYDAPSSDVLSELLKNEVPFSISLIIAPVDKHNKELTKFSAVVTQEAVEWPGFAVTDVLDECYLKTPTAKILSLLKSIALSESENVESAQTLNMPLSAQTSLQISLLAD